MEELNKFIGESQWLESASYEDIRKWHNADKHEAILAVLDKFAEKVKVPSENMFSSHQEVYKTMAKEWNANIDRELAAIRAEIGEESL